MFKKGFYCLFVLISIYGCGGGGDSGPTDVTPPPVNVSFSSSIQPIFNSRCITCHVAAGAEATFLPLTSGVSRGNLVNQPSTRSAGGGLLVKPGDSSNSVLYKRISGTSAGTQMPRNGTPVSENEQQLIKVWIDEGAKDN